MTRRRTILELLDAALGAVDPRAAVARAIDRDGETVIVAGETYRPKGRIVLLALGKAAATMAEGAAEALAGIPLTGVVAGPA
ncbi:MAG: DUF4147 domain-containing protein, partial [Actinobacteria bacterium]|nr:DUF4147 domain-containing protein [Actinomycetota bacterium]NIS31194.1 DUF4147 domain-containing protein [Actinomycetota bacterium]NIU19230.1 DUF4147 domain-containing protein [Actinomycetota bacterium]NIU66337.1 DUF4147 domain-containing protein [Actinomycetota bacterium]NIV55718.1 DUF4147 domain-containing protein [Actinomycetota bacterium]